MNVTLNTPVGELVRKAPGMGRLFESLGIDFCCGGRKSLGEACAARGLDGATVVALLEAAPLPLSDCPDPHLMSLTALTQHIVSTHHGFLREELPRLSQWTDKVATAHGSGDRRLIELASIFRTFRAELEQHMVKEEQILFPMIQQMELSGSVAASHCGSIESPIHVMEQEHDHAGQALSRMRMLTDDFTPPDSACNTYRAMLDALQRLERDMHQHVHEENNVLFPRATELQTQLLSNAA